MEPERRQRRFPDPALVAAAIDLAVAFLLLVNSGFTWAFALVAGVGIALAVLGLWGLQRPCRRLGRGSRATRSAPPLRRPPRRHAAPPRG